MVEGYFPYYDMDLVSPYPKAPASGEQAPGFSGRAPSLVVSPGLGDCPDWVRDAVSTRVWAEDDATVSHPDHEGLRSAARRLLGEAEVAAVVDVWDGGDTTYELLASQYVLVDSYPGNSQVRRLKSASVLAEERERGTTL